MFKGFFIDQKYFRSKDLIPEVDWISGVCFVMRHEMALRLQFEEHFFMYAEDIALSREIRRYGKIIYFPHACVIHRMESLSSERSRALWLDSLFRYYRMRKRDRSRRKLWLLKTIFIFGFLARAMGYSVRNMLSKHKNREKGKELLFYCRHIMSGFFR